MSRTILRTPTEFILLADAAPVIGGQITYLQGRQYINGSVTGSKIKIFQPNFSVFWKVKYGHHTNN